MRKSTSNCIAAFLHILAIWSIKLSIKSMSTPSNLTVFLHTYSRPTNTNNTKQCIHELKTTKTININENDETATKRKRLSSCPYFLAVSVTSDHYDRKKHKCGIQRKLCIQKGVKPLGYRSRYIPSKRCILQINTSLER